MKKRPDPRHPGDVLQQARVRAEMSSASIESRLGISTQQREAIEEWRLKDLPDNAHLIPILKRYTTIVAVDFSKLQSDYPEALEQRASISMRRAPAGRLDKPLVFMTSIAKVGLVLGVVAIIGGYVAWQSSSLSGRPQLEVYVEDQTSIVADFIEISGKTSTSSQIFVNGSSILVEEDGAFSASVVLQTGPNDITVRAVNNVGGETEQAFTVVRED